MGESIRYFDIKSDRVINNVQTFTLILLHLQINLHTTPIISGMQKVHSAIIKYCVISICTMIVILTKKLVIYHPITNQQYTTCNQIYLSNLQVMLSYFSTKDKVKRMVNKGYILKIIDVKTSDLSDDVIEQNYESVREYFNDE